MCIQQVFSSCFSLSSQNTALSRVRNVGLAFGISAVVSHTLITLVSRMFPAFSIVAKPFNCRVISVAVASFVTLSVDLFTVRILKSKQRQKSEELLASTLESGRELLKKYPQANLANFVFRSGTAYANLQPLNPEISKFAYLRSVLFDKMWEAAQKCEANQLWTNSEMVQYAREYMIVCYLASTLTLEELEPYQKECQRISDSLEPARKRAQLTPDVFTPAQTLTYQDGYAYLSFFYCSLAYHFIRGGYTRGYNEEVHGYAFQPPVTVVASKEHAMPFYTSGTWQANCRELYNDFCQRVRDRTSITDLAKADSRHVSWIMPDKTFSEVFNPSPDSIPT